MAAAQPHEIIATDLAEAARAGDWDRLEALCLLLPTTPPTLSPTELSDYLLHLRACVIAAKTTRADLLKSIHRLTAASRFNQFG